MEKKKVTPRQRFSRRAGGNIIATIAASRGVFE
jgi:hypothetical protein